MLKYSKMVAGYCPLPKLNKNCTKTVGVSESGEADRQTGFDVETRWTVGFQAVGTRLVVYCSQHCSTLVCFAGSTMIYFLVLVWELHGMVWMYPGGLLPKWFGIVWWCWLHPGGLLLKWFPPSLTPILGHGHPLHPPGRPRDYRDTRRALYR